MKKKSYSKTKNDKSDKYQKLNWDFWGSKNMIIKSISSNSNRDITVPM